MKNLTPAKMILMVMVIIGSLIGLFVAKKLLAVEPPPKKALIRNIPLSLGDLPPGTVIKKEHIGTGPWPTEDVKNDVLLGEGAIIGRIVKIGIKAANPIHGNSLYAFGELPPLKVSDGFQAMTIRAGNNAAILDGLIKPGDHVDIHFTLNSLTNDPRVAKLGGVTMTLFRGVRVLALNRDFVQAPLQNTQNSVTVEIPETDTNILLLASGKGELTMSYTSKNEGVSTVAISDSDRATLEEILNLPPVPEPPKPEPPPPPPPAPPAPVMTRVYRRSNHQVNAFDATTNEPVTNLTPLGGSGLQGSWSQGWRATGRVPGPPYVDPNTGRIYPPAGAVNGYNGQGQPGYGNPGYNNNPGYNPGGAPGVPSTWADPGYGPSYGPGYGPSYSNPGYAPQPPYGPRVSQAQTSRR